MGRILSRIGIGAATVDTVLPKLELQPGETVQVDVALSGGDSDQEIEGIVFVLKTRVESDGDSDEYVLAEFEADRPVSLSAEEERTIPVDVEVPLWTPVTTGGVSVWLETRLEIDWARDPTDEDEVEVVPDESVSALFEALDDLGFVLGSADLVDVPHVDDRPVAQRFRFRSAGGEYEADLDAVEVTVMPRRDDLRVFVEFDLKATIADDHDMDFDRQEEPMTLEWASVEAIRGRLEDGIRRHI